MPIRKIKSSGGKITGKFPSLKMGKMLQYESTIERDCLFLLDYEADVTYIEVQPLTIEYEHGGKTLHYTPDIHFVRAGQNILTECKPAEKVNTEDNQRKFAAGRTHCAKRGCGWSFQVITDQDLRSGYRLRNVMLLRMHARHVIKPEFKGWIYALLQGASEPPTIGHIQTAASIPLPHALTALLHMAYHHEIAIPLDDAPISTNSPVHLPGRLPSGGKS